MVLPKRAVIHHQLSTVILLLSCGGWFGAVANAAEPPNPATDREGFVAWQQQTRNELSTMLGIPKERVPLDAEARGQHELDEIVIEKWVYTSEPGSRIPAILYRPKIIKDRRPGIVLTFGHGGSKSHPEYQYIGQLYAKLGIICLAADPIGEEERHIEGKRGTRAHDPQPVHERAWNAGRPIIGKMIWDTMRGIDFLLARDDIDPARLGVAGNSLGGAVAGWMQALEPRLSAAIVSGWAFDDVLVDLGKFCTRVPNQKLRAILSWDQFLTLGAPHCSVLIPNGDADIIIDLKKDKSAWRGTQQAVDTAVKVYATLGNPDGIQTWFEPDGGHRPYPAHPEPVKWLLERMALKSSSANALKLIGINFGEWCARNDVTIEKLYGTQLHDLGATVTECDARYIPPQELAVLKPNEFGSTLFTIDGWLQMVAPRP